MLQAKNQNSKTEILNLQEDTITNHKNSQKMPFVSCKGPLQITK